MQESTQLSGANQNRELRSALGSFLWCCAVATGVFALLFGEVGFWKESTTAGLSERGAIVVTLLALAVALAIGGRRLPSLKLSAFLLAIIAWFLSDALTRQYSWFYGLPIRGEILLCGAFGLWLLVRAPQRVLVGVAVVAALLPAIAFLSHLGSRLMISDDHASFYYRLLMLREQLPFVPFYNTDWNGGFDARDFFATGALNVFPIFVGLSAIFSDDLAYNLTATWTAYLLPPICMFFAAILVTRSRVTAAFAAILVGGASLLWARWSLVYGTLGFCTSTALFPLVTALTWRALHEPDFLRGAGRVIGFAALWTLFLLWPGSMFMVAPIVIYGLWHLKGALSSRGLIAAAVLILVVNLPWMLLFSKVSQVGSFVTVTKVTDGTASAQIQAKKEALGARGVRREISIEDSLRAVRENAGSANPLVLLLALPGLLMLSRPQQRLFALTIGYLVVAGAVIAPLKPHLELERLLLVAVLACVIPAAHVCSRMTDKLGEHFRREASSFRKVTATLLFIVPIGMIFASPFVAASVASNRSILKFYAADDIWNGVRQTIAEFGKDNGRVLYSGFLLHELDGGHAAPLPVLTGVPAVASSQFHNLWAYRQVFPKSFIERGDTGIEEYLNLMNIGGIFAHEKQWRDYFSTKPDRYELVRRIGRFSFFKRLNFTSNFVNSGEVSKIEITRDRITLTPTSSSVQLKFIYLDFLVSSGCAIKGEDVAPDLKLISLTECTPGQEIVIRSKSPLRRLLD
jgi:hypothetical protein